MGEMVKFPSNGGTCDGYLAPPSGGTGAGVIDKEHSDSAWRRTLDLLGNRL